MKRWKKRHISSLASRSCVVRPKGDLSGWVVNAFRADTKAEWRVTAIAVCVAR